MSTPQEQIDQLSQILQSAFESNCYLNITGHATPDHLTVLQTGDDGTHQLLLSITYIGKEDDFNSCS